MNGLANRVAIVTGASAGIGLAIAQEFVRLGARVVVNARRANRLDEVVASLGRDHAAAYAGDCAEPTSISGMLDLAKARFGAEADLIVVNAGRGLKGSVSDSDTSQWEEMVRTNVLGAARLMRAAAERMGRASAPDWTKSPRDIIVLGSVVGRHVSPFSSMYGGTKFAVHGMVEGLRRELGPKGIRVTLIEPGFVVSDFQGVAGYDPAWFKTVVERIGPVLEPGDVARAAAFVALQPASVHVSDILIRPTRQDYP